MRALESDALGFKGTASVREKSEREIVEAVLGGDLDQFGELVTRYQDQVFGMIMRQVGEREIASELTQDSFLRAYQALPKFRFESSFGTWITRISLNLTNSYFSSKRYRDRMKEDQLNLERHDRAEESAYPSDENRAKALRAAVGELKPHYRDVVVLCGFEGRSYEEAAATLQIPIGTIRSRLSAARHILKGVLVSEGRDE